MRAILFESFGPSTVLRVGSAPTPLPGPGEVRIRISHTSVNPVDFKIREGKLAGMFPHVFPIIPGWDVAGTIDLLGEGVADFAIGDAVFAYTRLPQVQHGTYAEWIAVPASFVARAPKRVGPEVAGGIPLIGLTALQMVQDVAKVGPRDRVLVTGAGGGVGSYTVQLARLAGAEVTATGGPANKDWVTSLGARFIDHHAPDLAERLRAAGPFDVLLDTVGGAVLAAAEGAVGDSGRRVGVVSTPKGGAFHFVKPDAPGLAHLASLLDAGTLIPARSQVRPVTEAAPAMDEVERGTAGGKVVLAITF